MKKKLILSSLLLSTLGSISIASSCSSNSTSTVDNPEARNDHISSNESKEILIAVDGKQTTFYDEVNKLFNKSESYAKGYRLKMVQKDVFSALDTQVGIDDREQVPDIFYAPQDRITDFVVNNKVVELNKFNPTLFNEITKEIGSTEEEKKQLESFGSVTGLVTKNGQIQAENRLYAIRHNTEGIILVSNKEQKDALADLQNTSTNSLKELVEKGDAIIRMQDLWYGNGILAGVFKKLNETKSEKDKVNYISKFLYSKDGKISSGFFDKNENIFREEFKKATGVAAEIYWPVFKAAYLMSKNDFKTSVWYKKGISQEDLKAVLTSDMAQVQSKIFELMKDGKINYAIIGTWDLQNAEKSANAKSFFNVINATDEYEYIQAKGAWSFLINIRNNGASEQRKKAISELLKNIFSVNANFAYFKADSKVPYTHLFQDKIKKEASEFAVKENQEYFDFIKSLNYKSHQELMENFKEFVELNQASSLGIFYVWEQKVENTNDPIGQKNILFKENLKNNSEFNSIPKISQQSRNSFVETINQYTGLRNALAAMFEKKLSEFQSKDGKTWLIQDNIIKSDKLSTKIELLEDENSWHLRKIEKYLFGANGDNSSEKLKLVNSLVEIINDNEKLENKFNEIENKALSFVKEVALTPADDLTIKKAARLYFGAYVNQAKLKVFIEDQVKKAENELPNNIKIKTIEEKISQYLKTLSFDKILNVLTSTKTIENDGLGIFKTQNGRFDNSNPQFGSVVWDKWNDKTFGNVDFFNKLVTNNQVNKDLNWFKQEIFKQLSENFEVGVRNINDSKGDTFIKFDK
ncbi:hypothetical protein [Mycoplasmopsis cricetuli]|uniref:hypothetical protein n=1 Tax=Mycoplasmopsis cricetuli TaxID=171283 RepID=UPI00047203CC|nr:hypothetical protein [Mycoplasmopsis cricetuli]